jgi:hypothetical protein
VERGRRGLLTAALLGRFSWNRPGLCHCRFRMAVQACSTLTSSFFLQPKPALLPSKAVLRRPRPAAQLCAAADCAQGLARQIGGELMPLKLVHALAVCKHAAATVNEKLGLLDPTLAGAIREACQVCAIAPHAFRAREREWSWWTHTGGGNAGGDVWLAG